MLKKLRLKFICINMTFVTIMLVFIMLTVIQFTKFNMKQDSIQMLNNIATNPLYLIRPNDSIDVDLPYFSLRLDDENQLIESVSSYYNLSNTDFFHEVIYASSEITDQVGELPSYNLRFMRLSTPTDQFMIFVDISHETQTLQTLTRNCLIIGVMSFFIFLIISIFFANWAVKPVDKAWKQQKQFIADASHELKTPLAVIMTNAELLQIPSSTEERKTQFAENIYTMSIRMRNLVNGLLELSKIDNGLMQSSMTHVNFSSLTENSVYLFEPLFFEQDVLLEYELTPEIYVTGSETHLKQVVEILLDNALKYGATHNCVHVDLKKQKRCCHLTVSSTGTPLSQEDLKNIFKRFYRTDKTRSDSESYGLGLSIARSIILEHKGKIWAESVEGRNVFHVTLPMEE